ncbi:hypothetical protein FEK35_27505 [Nocardia cyriacigeorgica]|uniref:Uncharacterized protein n=1 Tax=Nocardia cyriacigeorgica TaxID=135487 RepID=A0A5R8P6C6_9NOCA|nr:alpha/beta hydrolase [Nocardia cyriacigeorgica]TLF96838.1 hypothetical protein FEK35_27505 [Nocardia cyriacigeorgica]
MTHAKTRIRAIPAALAAFLITATGIAWAADAATPIANPTGPHPVGRVDTTLANGHRTIAVSAWYPTTVAGQSPYIPAASDINRAHLAAQTAAWLRTPAAGPAMATATLPVTSAAPVDGTRLPVVIWSPGMGTPRWLSSGLAVDLAARGIVVITMDHTGESPAVDIAGRVHAGSPPDSTDTSYMRRALATRVADTRTVLDHLAQLPLVGPHLDLSRIAMAGHSYGGQTTITAMSSDPRIRTGVVLDGSAGWDGVTPPPAIDRPVLLLASGDMVHASWTHTRATIATIAGAGHYTGTDLPAFGCAPEFCGTINPHLGTELTRGVVAAWLDRELLGHQHPMPHDPALRWQR